MNENESIQCYIENEWHSYLAGSLPEEERLEMEEHLLSCDTCLQVYLNLLEEQGRQEYLLGEDFTARVLNQTQSKKSQAGIAPARLVPVFKQPVPKARDKSGSRINLLISYCAAASIVFFFWTGGYISGLSNALNEGLVKNHGHVSEVVEDRLDPSISLIQPGWTKKVIQEKRPSIIENIIQKKE
ncbi:zf-HC2 domain-containing protein [Dehalobacter restrictus]|uniref:Anti-sigma-W factor RsiW n=1 Tax=Dehalobacter restrictus TaxID=55583 RepID=A0A857DH29_9FIRM|nr:zf-HC2 domain-containing protein [Dehalobacter restrictus]MCM1567623.1 zf-HC2 domain-containing protein [Dehalobacter sp.]QHA00103.1 hypothetical protein GQ588_05295 [Dehalobacter restrictus]